MHTRKWLQPSGLPHRRGGVSRSIAITKSNMGVFPTGVGVFLASVLRGDKPLRLPHRRGGVSNLVAGVTGRDEVFPTGVGVFLCR